MKKIFILQRKKFGSIGSRTQKHGWDSSKIYHSLLLQVRFVADQHDGELIAVFDTEDLFVKLWYLREKNENLIENC